LTAALFFLLIAAQVGHFTSSRSVLRLLLGLHL